MSYTHLDRNKKFLAIGNDVQIIEIPSQLIQGLPHEDQIEIQEQAGEILTILAINENGDVELEFVGSSGCIHTIWIAPHFLVCVDKPA